MSFRLALFALVLLTLSPLTLAASGLSDQLREAITANDGWSTDTQAILQKNVDALSALASG